jgi:hypothetical protein
LCPEQFLQEGFRNAPDLPSVKTRDLVSLGLRDTGHACTSDIAKGDVSQTLDADFLRRLSHHFDGAHQREQKHFVSIEIGPLPAIKRVSGMA